MANKAFASAVAQWAFSQRAVLRASPLRHTLVSSSAQSQVSLPAAYACVPTWTAGCTGSAASRDAEKTGKQHRCQANQLQLGASMAELQSADGAHMAESPITAAMGRLQGKFTKEPEGYRVSDEVDLGLDIEELRDGSWRPYS